MTDATLMARRGFDVVALLAPHCNPRSKSSADGPERQRLFALTLPFAQSLAAIMKQHHGHGNR
jgi:hypothetical protein